MDSTRARTFVLGAALLLACRTAEPAGPDRGTSTGRETTSTDGPSSGSSSGSSSSGSSSGKAADGDSTAMGSSSSSTTTAGEASTRGSESGGTTGEPASACQQGCAVEFQCTMDWSTEEECVMACEANLVRAAAFAPSCADAWENVSECVGTLTCEELLEWQMPTTFPYPCADADQGLQFECKGQ